MYLQCRQITLYNETADILIKRWKKGWASFPVIRRVNDLYIAEEIATTTYFYFFFSSSFVASQKQLLLGIQTDQQGPANCFQQQSAKHLPMEQRMGF